MSAAATVPEVLVPEALALIEYSSIATGTRAVDALLKKAPVKIERAGTLQPGKFAVVFSGDVASVDEGYQEALRVGNPAVLDEIMLPMVEPTVYAQALVLGPLDASTTWSGDTLAVVETSTMAAIVHACDVAVKGANVTLVKLRMGDELGGKGLGYLLGEQHDIEAACELVSERCTRAERNLMVSITARLDDELRAILTASTRFWS